MSSRYINKYAGSTATDAPANRSKAAGVGYDTVTGAYNYNDGGVLRPLVAPGRPVTAVLATGNLTLSPDLHDGRPIVLNAAAGATFTLPAATGSMAKYLIYIGTLITSNSFVLKVANASDYFRGFGYTSQDAGGAGVTWPTANTATVATESDTLTWNRTTTGLGTIGDLVEVVDIAANVWAIEASYNSNGTEASPFSVAV